MATSSSDGKVSLSTFPSNRFDALTILYMQNQDLSSKTPEDLANMYEEVRDRIHKEFDAILDRKKQERRASSRLSSIFD